MTIKKETLKVLTIVILSMPLAAVLVYCLLRVLLYWGLLLFLKIFSEGIPFEIFMFGKTTMVLTLVFLIFIVLGLCWLIISSDRAQRQSWTFGQIVMVVFSCSLVIIVACLLVWGVLTLNNRRLMVEELNTMFASVVNHLPYNCPLSVPKKTENLCPPALVVIRCGADNIVLPSVPVNLSPRAGIPKELKTVIVIYNNNEPKKGSLQCAYFEWPSLKILWSFAMSKVTAHTGGPGMPGPIHGSSYERAAWKEIYREIGMQP